MNLADMAMLKDNHVSLMGGGLGIRASVGAIRKKYPKLKIIVECDNLIQLRSALDARADTVMLDNMLPAQIRKAVDIVRTRKNKRPLIEVSGGITITNVRKYALKGIDYISVGAITHSAPALDISLDIN
jgi:nicotinate-nucleotide pyrophosphorylase (carboxylating)